MRTLRAMPCPHPGKMLAPGAFPPQTLRRKKRPRTPTPTCMHTQSRARTHACTRTQACTPRHAHEITHRHAHLCCLHPCCRPAPQVGAKIQCSSCYIAYHPLCARMAGLHMEMVEPYPDSTDPFMQGPASAYKQVVSYCPKHCQPKPHLSGARTSRSCCTAQSTASPSPICQVRVQAGRVVLPKALPAQAPSVRCAAQAPPPLIAPLSNVRGPS